jgi:hypothetical protein
MTLTRREFVWTVSLVTAGAAGGAGLSAAGPIEVLILRSGEEPAGSDIHLSDAGKARAKALATWIPAKYGNPDFLFASKPTQQSRRAVETLEPLASALKLKVQDPFASDDFAKLAARLLKEPEFAGKRIVICWMRGNIPNLATALGAAKPPAWPDTQYDHVWRLQFGTGGVILEDTKQALTPGK